MKEDMTQRELRSLGAQIRRFRQIGTMTQAELAETLSQSTNYIGLLERGQRAPSFDTLVRIAGIFGVQASRLLEAQQEEKMTPRDRTIARLNTFLKSRSVDEVDRVYRVAHAALITPRSSKRK